MATDAGPTTPHTPGPLQLGATDPRDAGWLGVYAGRKCSTIVFEALTEDVRPEVAAANAAELVRRWNLFPELEAAVRAAAEGSESNGPMADPLSADVRRQLWAALAKAAPPPG